MSDTTTVLIFALLPVLGNFAGSLLAECIHTPRWLLGAALHGAAGVAIALVSIDLMPRILQSAPMWLLVLAFLAGAFVSVMLYRGAGWARWRAGAGSRGAWMVYFAVMADLFSDGMMTGAGSAVGTELGFLIGATQAVANIPGGFAATANFRDDRMPRWRRMAMAGLLLVPTLASALFGFVLLRGGGAWFQSAALAFIIGLLLLATVEDVLPEGDAPQPPRWISTAAFAGGFAAMALLSGYLR